MIFFSNVDENVALYMASAPTVEPAVIDTDLEPVVRNVAPAQAVICTAAATVIVNVVPKSAVVCANPAPVVVPEPCETCGDHDSVVENVEPSSGFGLHRICSF